MENWVKTPLKLEGKSVTLRSLDSSHIPELGKLAETRQIWDHYVIDASKENTFKQAFDLAMVNMEKGKEYCFTIFDKKGNAVGSTRFLDINQRFRKLEIGWTWLHPEVWGTAVNPECKLLLLTYCFETLGTVRVQLKTDELNSRSRRAIEKIGARFEGILRNDMIREDGSYRHSAYYSIIESEWPEAKKLLQERLVAQ